MSQNQVHDSVLRLAFFREKPCAEQISGERQRRASYAKTAPALDFKLGAKKNSPQSG
jgi:hypothetical protein